jgi:uncharacterized caspase-like protein
MAGFAPAAFGASAPGRIALVIGNNSYLQAPLTNPGNDARAMAALFKEAGFATELVLDATQNALTGAVARFLTSVGRSEVREAVLYYAGHGAQLEWRNYLLPVDARISNPDDLRTRCLDLNQVLLKLPANQDKTFLLVLDACRNNPFGASYTPSQAGLSQFDAPPGTLLAFATGPGRVASDGAGEHGLYSEHLLKELKRPGVPIEEVLKRVRLNVRLASQGEQIPWESTSLESNVVLVGTSLAPLTDEQEAANLDEEAEAWHRASATNTLEGWIGYLQKYPDGKFSEVAQVHIDTLMPARNTPQKSGAEAGKVMATPSANPFSSGRYPLDRLFTVGDRATYRITNLRNPEGTGKDRAMEVSAVDAATGRVKVNKGGVVWDLLGNPLQTGRNQKFDVPAQYYPGELFVGKKWSSLVHRDDGEGEITEIALRFAVVARETITVPAGSFDCFRIEGKGSNSKGVRINHSYWISPGVNFFVRREILRQKNGRTWNRWELASLSQTT